MVWHVASGIDSGIAAAGQVRGKAEGGGAHEREEICLQQQGYWEGKGGRREVERAMAGGSVHMHT